MRSMRLLGRLPGDIGQLLKTLIEVQPSQNELLTRLGSKLDTAICVLELVSKNTCETLNEVHDQMARQGVIVECKEVCAQHPPACVPCADATAPKHTSSECEVVERRPHCKYEPCKPREDEGGSAVATLGTASPQRAFGAPFPPAIRTDDPEDEANEFPAPQVRRGPFRGF